MLRRNTLAMLAAHAALAHMAVEPVVIDPPQPKLKKLKLSKAEKKAAKRARTAERRATDGVPQRVAGAQEGGNDDGL